MIFAVSPIIQKKEIDAYCFRDCKKIIVAGIDMGAAGPCFPCPEEDCPYEEARTEVLGQVDGEDVCMRKLKWIG